jgi:hypothetical protein
MDLLFLSFAFAESWAPELAPVTEWIGGGTVLDAISEGAALHVTDGGRHAAIEGDQRPAGILDGVPIEAIPASGPLDHVTDNP